MAVGERALAPKWSPLGAWQRLHRTVEQPSDLPLALQLGYFIWRAPSKLEVSHLAHLLDRLRSKPRPAASSIDEGFSRIMRLSEPWLRLRAFRERNTCYLRALILYRFLEAGERDLRIHFVVEPGVNLGGRLRGHAWVTVDGEVLDVQDDAVVERRYELYSHPPT